MRVVPAIWAAFFGGGSLVMVGAFFVMADLPLIYRVLSVVGSLISGTVSAFFTRRVRHKALLPKAPIY
jgi:membrane protein implicated in regulation of membrane protease activity